MTGVTFFSENGVLTGFSVCGHSTQNSRDTQGKLVCSAVSSAAYLTANTILEVIGDPAQVTVDEAVMELHLKNPGKESRAVLEGFRLHITELAKQYGNRIQIITEV